MNGEVPDFIVRGLIEVGGMIDDNTPRFRIRRADKVMIVYEGQLLPRYWTKKVPVIEGYWVLRPNESGELDHTVVSEDRLLPGEIFTPKMGVQYIAPKYFVLEQWLHPTSYGQQWEQAQHTTREWVRYDSLGDLADSDGYFHMGNFVNPDGTPWELGMRMVEYVAEKWQQTKEDPVFKGWLPSDPIPAWALEEADKIDQEKQQEALKEQSRVRYETMMNIFQPAKKLLFHSRPNAGGGKLYVR